MCVCVVLCVVAQSCPTLCDPMDRSPSRLLWPWGFSRQRILEWVAIPSSRGSSQPKDQIQVSNIAGRFFTIWSLSHQGSPRILEWVAYPFSRGSSWPRNWTGVSCIAGRFFTSWATREAHLHTHIHTLYPCTTQVGNLWVHNYVDLHGICMPYLTSISEVLKSQPTSGL